MLCIILLYLYVLCITFIYYVLYCYIRWESIQGMQESFMHVIISQRSETESALQLLKVLKCRVFSSRNALSNALATRLPYHLISRSSFRLSPK